jgi:ketosteroid isomerase-like protein
MLRPEALKGVMAVNGVSTEEANNLDVIQRAFTAFATGDDEVLAKTFAPDVHYHFLPHAPFKTDYLGSSAVLELFGQLTLETSGTLRTTVLAMAANGDRVFVLYRATGTRSGKTLDSSDVLVFTLANGVVTEAFTFPGNFPASVAFWS